MKKFKFNLQKLLEIRQKKEDQEKIELAKASMAYQNLLNKKEKLISNVKNIRKELSKDRSGISLARLQTYDKLTKDTDLAVKALEPVIEEKKKIMQEHIRLYANLQKDRKAVEILRDKAFKRFQEEQDRAEQKELDEIAKNTYLKHKAKPLNTEN